MYDESGAVRSVAQHLTRFRDGPPVVEGSEADTADGPVLYIYERDVDRRKIFISRRQAGYSHGVERHKCALMEGRCLH